MGKHTPHEREVVGLNPIGCSISCGSLIRSLTEEQQYLFSIKNVCLCISRQSKFNVHGLRKKLSMDQIQLSSTKASKFWIAVHKNVMIQMDCFFTITFQLPNCDFLAFGFSINVSSASR